MSVKIIYSDTPKKGWQYNAKTKKYFAYQVEAYVYDGEGRKPTRYRYTFFTKREADDEFIKLQVKSKEKKLGIYEDKSSQDNHVMTGELFQKWLDKIKSKKERTAAARNFNYFLQNMKVEFVTDLRTAHFTEYINRREADGIEKSSINREINRFSAAINAAPEMFTVLENWIAPKIARPKFKRKPRARPITEREWKLIKEELMKPRAANEREYDAKLRHRVGRVFNFAWLAGLRHEELLKLKKSDYDREENVLRVVRWKTGEITRFEFLPDIMIEALDDAVAASGSDHIFTLTGKPIRDFYKVLGSACRAKGIPFGTKVENGLRLHDARHSFTTRMIQVTDPATTGSFTGHSRQDMVLYYSHASNESRKTAMEKMYGKKSEISREKLHEIYNQIKNGELKFESFADAILNKAFQ